MLRHAAPSFPRADARLTEREEKEKASSRRGIGKKETARLATCGREVFYGNFAVGEYTLALRLESELSDLRAGYANPCACKQTLPRFRARNRQKKKQPNNVRLFLFW